MNDSKDQDRPAEHNSRESLFLKLRHWEINHFLINPPWSPLRMFPTFISWIKNCTQILFKNWNILILFSQPGNSSTIIWKFWFPKFFLFLFGGVKLRRQHWCFLALVLVVAVICLGVLLPMSGNTGNLNKEQQKNLIAQLLTEVPLIDG